MTWKSRNVIHLKSLTKGYRETNHKFVAFKLAISVTFNNNAVDTVIKILLSVGHEEMGQGHYHICEFK